MTPQQRRMYLARELAVYARDAGMRELATQLDELSALDEPHPTDAPPRFTFNIDRANGDEPNIDPPASPVTTIVVRREPRTLAGDPVRGETSEPTDEPGTLLPMGNTPEIDPRRARQRQRSTFIVA